MAVGRIENKIIISGEDSASATIDRARKGLKDLSQQAKKTGQDAASVDISKGIRESSGDIESALQGVKDFTPGIAGELSGLGDAFGATEAVMRLLPGHIGLAATALAGLALGAKLLTDHIREGEAKLQLLGNSGTGKLKEDLDLSTDAAIKLSQAFDDMRDKRLRPTQGVLQQIRESAVSMGEDGDEAITAYVKALEGGDAALNEFEKKYGRIDGLQKDTSALVARHGLSAALLGLAREQTAEEQRNAEVAKLAARLKADNVVLTQQENALVQQRGLSEEGATVAVRVNASIKARALESQIESTKRLIDVTVGELGSIQAGVKARREEAEEIANLTSRAERLNAEAAAAADKGTRATKLAEAAGARRLAAQKALNDFDRLHGSILDAKLIRERELLAVKLNQVAGAELQAKDATAAEARARASAGAQAAAANRTATLDNKIRKEKALAERDGIVTFNERLRLIDLEAEKDVLAAQQAKTSRKVRADAIVAIEQERINKIAALERETNEKAGKAQDDLNRKYEESKKSQEDLARSEFETTTKLREAADKGIAIGVARRIEAFRTAGNEERALDLETAEVRRTSAQAVLDADRLLQEQRRRGFASKAEEDLAEAEATNKKLEAADKLTQAERKLADTKAQAARESRAFAADALTGVTSIMSAMAQVEVSFAQLATAGTGINLFSSEFKKLDESIAKTGVTAANVTQGLTSVIGGTAAAGIDASTRQTLEQLDADKARRLSTATTEKERAEITAEFEKKKADAVLAAERRKAGIMAIMEAAQALALAFTPGRQAEAVGHAASAALYAGVAGGVIGGGGAVGSASSQQSASLAAQKESGSGAGGLAGGGGTTNVVVHFNQPLATAHDIGKGVKAAQAALTKTGMSKVRGV